MKKRILSLALAAVLACTFAGLAAAEADFSYFTAPRLKFLVGAASKDTTSILNQAVGTTVASCTDTTEWFDASGYHFPPGAFTAQPTVILSVNTAGATPDSVGVLFQYRSDGDATKFWSGTQGYVVHSASKLQGIATALTIDTLPARWFRVILWANDSSTNGVVHTYSVTPLVLGQKAGW